MSKRGQRNTSRTWLKLSEYGTYLLSCLPCKTRYIVSLLKPAHPSKQHTASSPPNEHHIHPHQWEQLYYNLFLLRIGKGKAAHTV